MNEVTKTTETKQMQVCEYRIPFEMVRDAILQFVGVETGTVEFGMDDIIVRTTQEEATASVEG